LVQSLGAVDVSPREKMLVEKNHKNGLSRWDNMWFVAPGLNGTLPTLCPYRDTEIDCVFGFYRRYVPTGLCLYVAKLNASRSPTDLSLPTPPR
jgi:hypothetical protein